MADTVYWETDDVISEDALARVFARDNVTDYVERGAGVTADHVAETIDVDAGYSIVTDDNNHAYHLLTDSRGAIDLSSTNGDNFVYVVYDPVDDATDVVVTTGATPDDPHVHIATVDAANDTVTEVNRDPDVVAESLSVTGSASIGGSATVDGAADVAGGMNVDGDVTTDGDVNMAGAGTIDYPADAGPITAADMPVDAADAGAEQSIGVQIDATDLLRFYAEGDGAGGIQNAAVQAPVPITDPTNNATVYDPTTQTIGGGAAAADVTGATVNGADVETDHFSASDGGTIAPGEAATLYVTSVPDGATIYVARATHLLSDGQAAPTGCDLEIVTFAGDGTATHQTTIVAGDGATVHDDNTDGANYANASGGDQTVAIIANNGSPDVAGGAAGVGDEIDVKNDVNGRVAE